MNFTEYEYKRPDLDAVLKEYRDYIDKFQKAPSATEQIQIIHELNVLRDEFESMAVLCEIRNSIDTTDTFYETEMDFYNNNMPYYVAVSQEFSKAMFTSPHRKELEEAFGNTIFKMIEVELKTFDEKIIPDLQLENKLATEYSKLIASAKIPFDGKINNLSQMSPYTQSLDRSVRKAANDAIGDYIKENMDKFDDIYDQMVKVRTKIAHDLGFKNYVELGYLRLGRTDYDATMVANYRKQVYNDLLPVVEKLVSDQGKRLGIKEMKNYDLGLNFLSGNPTPKGGRDWMVEKATKMYHEMSKEAGEFFDYMTSHGLLDLDAKAGKQAGGYTTYIPKFKSPFIFANFNGTKGDVDVLTHEAGHAFQVYSSQGVALPEYRWPTYEACEIHSMSMEFFAWPWMEDFFKEDAAKYLYSHLCGTITFIPYGVSVDEFQEIVYTHPEMTKAERRAAWRACEKKYLPYKVYDNPVYEEGTLWYRQGHIFQSPFYYIDYTLAQVCAQQFWIKNQKNHLEAWKDYYHLCCLGGSMSFLSLLKEANLMNPFVDGTIKETTKELQKWLNDFDQSKLK